MTASALPLRPGAVGEPVRDLQRRLARAGHPSPDPPGTYADATAAAVTAFQQARGLREDGICGDQTWFALVEAGWLLGDRLLYQRTPMLRGDDVADLQSRLGALGFFAARIDGILGPLTTSALTDFQRNAGLTADGICGPDTIAALGRVRGRPTTATKAGVIERDALLAAAPRRLQERRILVGDTGGLDSLATAVAKALGDLGAVVAVCHHPDQSAQAAEANAYGADVYLGLALQPQAGCTCSYYGHPGYRSVGGEQLANQLARSLPGVLGAPDATDGSARPMRLPVLRETRMVAVWCEMGPASAVVERSGELSLAVADGLAAWTAAPVEG